MKPILFDGSKVIFMFAWARNDEALFAIKREMERSPELQVTIPSLVDKDILEQL